MRRERDQVRETLEKVERNLNESRQHFESEEKDLRQRLNELQKQTEVLADVRAQLEQLQIENENLKKLSEQDHSIYIIEKATLETKIMDLEQQLSITGTAKKRFEKNSPEKLLQDSMKVSLDLRQQLDDVKSNYNEEVEKIRRQAEKNRQDWQKERTEMQRKIKDLQENVKILEIDRRNMLATRDETEAERNQLSSERENLLERIHDGEIHQLANKYKLDKVSDQLGDLQSKALQGERRELQDLVRKALEQLMGVREDMAKTKELGKALEVQNRPPKSVENSPAIAKRTANSTEVTPSAPPRTPKKKEEKETPPAPIAEKSRSMSTESEMSDLGRLRMRSPSPRKITNYPEAPPNMIYSNDKNAIEYDSNGVRHWKRRSMRRSISLDPGGSGLGHSRSASTGTHSPSPSPPSHASSGWNSNILFSFETTILTNYQL